MNSSSKDFLTWKKLNNNECFCFLFFLLGRCSTFVRPNRKGLKSSHSSSFITWSLARDWSWHIMRSTQLIFFASFKPCWDTFVRNYNSSKDIILKKSSFCVYLSLLRLRQHLAVLLWETHSRFSCGNWLRTLCCC